VAWKYFTKNNFKAKKNTKFGPYGEKKVTIVYELNEIWYGVYFKLVLKFYPSWIYLQDFEKPQFRHNM